MTHSPILIALYEIGQIDEVISYLDREHISLASCHIVALEYEVDRTLSDRGIVHASLPDYVPLTTDFGSLLHHTEAMARQWVTDSTMAFFSCHNIHLGESLEGLLQFHLDHLTYGLYVAEKILKQHLDAKTVLVPFSVQRISTSAGPLSWHDANALATAFKFLAGKQNSTFIDLGIREVEYIGPTLGARLKKQALEMFLAVYNWLVKLLIPPKPLKLFVSDYWRHLAPFISDMGDAELILMDRSEARGISLRELIRHRLRLHHPSDFKRMDDIREIEDTLRVFERGWQTVCANREFCNSFTYNEQVIWPLVKAPLQFLITVYARRMVTDVICFERLFLQNGINRVLLRATMGGQYHFYLAAQVAERLTIPSIELQHATEITEPTSAFSRLGSRYLAAYGKRTRDLFVQNHGYDPLRIVAVGSPRFDRYLHAPNVDRVKVLGELQLDPLRPVVFVNVPAFVVGLLYYGALRLYDQIECFKVLARVQREIPGLQFIFKFRPGEGNFKSSYKRYLEEIFGSDNTDIAIAQREDTPGLMSASDVVISTYSTLTIEAMILRRPVILFPLHPWAKGFRDLFKKTVFVPEPRELAPLLRQLLAEGDLREQTIVAIDRYMQDEYSFDGNAAERIVELIRHPPVLHAGTSV